MTRVFTCSCLNRVRNGASSSGYFLATVDSFALLASQLGRLCCSINRSLDVCTTFLHVQNLFSFHLSWCSCLWTAYNMEYLQKFILPILFHVSGFSAHFSL